ncbi:MAG: hypothetical protein DMG30_08020 [Acidobacteria bacterium]|nr:MAG: hypothetical protein DMG30_08020 [Acidobacteriota bacterium]
MRKLCAVFAVAGLVFALGASAFAATQTITGQLIDQTCYKANKANTGVDHKMPEDTPGCATTCAKMGQPVALLTADGKVYTVTGDLAANNNAKLIPHMSHKVELTGDVTEKGSTMTIAASSLKMISR